MVRSSWLPPAAIVIALATWACGSGRNGQPPKITPTLPAGQPVPAASPVPAPAPEDPIETLIVTSPRHFRSGQKELELGHLERAKAEFNQALQVLLESRYGARSEPRIREQF